MIYKQLHELNSNEEFCFTAVLIQDSSSNMELTRQGEVKPGVKTKVEVSLGVKDHHKHQYQGSTNPGASSNSNALLVACSNTNRGHLVGQGGTNRIRRTLSLLLDSHIVINSLAQGQIRYSKVRDQTKVLDQPSSKVLDPISSKVPDPISSKDQGHRTSSAQGRILTQPLTIRRVGNRLLQVGAFRP